MNCAKIASPWVLSPFRHQASIECYVRLSLSMNGKGYYSAVQKDVYNRWMGSRTPGLAGFDSREEAMAAEDRYLEECGVVLVSQEKWDRLLLLK